MGESIEDVHSVKAQFRALDEGPVPNSGESRGRQRDLSRTCTSRRHGLDHERHAEQDGRVASERTSAATGAAAATPKFESQAYNVPGVVEEELAL